MKIEPFFSFRASLFCLQLNFYDFLFKFVQRSSGDVDETMSITSFNLLRWWLGIYFRSPFNSFVNKNRNYLIAIYRSSTLVLQFHPLLDIHFLEFLEIQFHTNYWPKGFGAISNEDLCLEAPWPEPDLVQAQLPHEVH